MKDENSVSPWIPVQLWLQRCSEDLGAFGQPPEFETGKSLVFYLERLFEKEREHMQETNALAIALIEGGPLLDNVSKWSCFFLFLRVQAAHDFCIECRSTGYEGLQFVSGPNPELTLEKNLEALLFSLWKQRGNQCLKLYALYCYLDTSFYAY